MTKSSLYVFTVLITIAMGWNGCGSKQDTSTNIEPEPTLGEDSATDDTKSGTILFFGNSLTAGYGVEPENAFPYLIQKRLDSMSLSYHVVNAGLSGETTASGVNRIEWVLREPVDVMILELGGNDGLRGIDPVESEKNLQKIIDLAKNSSPGIQIIVAGMEAPPNMGEEYVNNFRSIFKELSRLNNLPLIPFLLEDVGGEPSLNLTDGIHPNEEGHKIVADNVWTVLEMILSK